MASHIIGLSPADRKILTSLKQGSLHPSEIARRTGISRTTAAYRLQKLSRLGLTTKKVAGRKSIWDRSFIRTGKGDGVQIYTGEEFRHAYEHLFSLPGKSVIFCAQGDRSAICDTEVLGEHFIKQAHKIFKRKQLIMRGIGNQKVLRFFDSLNPDYVKSHIGRTTGVKVFSGNILLGTGEIMFTRKFLIFSNPAKQFALVITDKEIVNLAFDTISILFDSIGEMKTFDINDYLTKMTK